MDVMREAGYAPSERTVRRHQKRARCGEEVFTLEKESGRPPMLDEAQREICAGFVLANNLAHHPCQRANGLRSRCFSTKPTPAGHSPHWENAQILLKTRQITRFVPR